MIKPRKPPYTGTEKDPEQSILDINKMLREYGISAYQWTTLWEQGRVELRFVLENQDKRLVPVRLIAPAFLATRRSWNAKAGKYEKLEAIAFGLRDVQEEFLHDVIVKDRAGRETTVGEMVGPALASGTLDMPALTGKEEAE